MESALDPVLGLETETSTGAALSTAASVLTVSTVMFLLAGR
jgi:hypothetical protein